MFDFDWPREVYLGLGAGLMSLGLLPLVAWVLTRWWREWRHGLAIRNYRYTIVPPNSAVMVTKGHGLAYAFVSPHTQLGKRLRASPYAGWYVFLPRRGGIPYIGFPPNGVQPMRWSRHQSQGELAHSYPLSMLQVEFSHDATDPWRKLPVQVSGDFVPVPLKVMVRYALNDPVLLFNSVDAPGDVLLTGVTLLLRQVIVELAVSDGLESGSDIQQRFLGRLQGAVDEKLRLTVEGDARVGQLHSLVKHGLDIVGIDIIDASGLDQQTMQWLKTIALMRADRERQLIAAKTAADSGIVLGLTEAKRIRQLLKVFGEQGIDGSATVEAFLQYYRHQMYDRGIADGTQIFSNFGQINVGQTQQLMKALEELFRVRPDLRHPDRLRTFFEWVP